jgi:phosphoglycolate phosphatase-like HAD superfamily hydrolase
MKGFAPVSLPLPIPPVALLLDFDGVILQSVEIKIQAFLTIYKDEDPAKRRSPRVSTSARRGHTPRQVQFETRLFRTFRRRGLHRAPRDLVRRAGPRCSPRVPVRAGAQDFPAGGARSRRHAHRFRNAAGRAVDIVSVADWRATSKASSVLRRPNLRRSRESSGTMPMRRQRSLAVGDSTTEYDAAADLGIPFLGVVATGAHNPFRTGVPGAHARSDRRAARTHLNAMDWSLARCKRFDGA